jgi:hypothetical protein
VNVAIMRTFVRLREMLSTHEELRRKFDAISETLRREISGGIRHHPPDVSDASSQEKSDWISRKIRAGRQVSQAEPRLI